MRKLECFIGAKIFSSIDLRQLHAMQFMLYMYVYQVLNTLVNVYVHRQSVCDV